MTHKPVRRLLGVSAATALAMVGAALAPAIAAGPPHAPGEETVEGTNNLSVPAVFVPDMIGAPFSGTCTTADDSLPPVGEKGVIVDEVPEHVDYFVQGDDTWQADCDTALPGTLTVAAGWGDNLTNAPLKAGTPIRTEIGFLAPATDLSMSGYEVVKLDPSLLDRESHYGTLGDKVASYPEVRVWDAGVTLDIRSVDGTVVVADHVAFGAEVNSTGRVVYGFNWQKPVAGVYTVEVHAPGIELGSTDAGRLSDHNGDGANDTVTLDVTVGNKGGGGTGGGGRPGGQPGGGGGGRR